MSILHSLVLIATLASGAASQVQIDLPPGPAAQLLAIEASPAVGLPVQAVAPWHGAQWETAQPWDAWADAITDSAEPAARLHLMRVARSLGRSNAAWQHFAALPPAWAQASLQELLSPPAVIDGTFRFTPLLPPIPDFDRKTWEGFPPKRMYTARNLHLGATTVDLSVEDAPEGVEIHLTWKSGPELDLEVQFPMPAGRKARLIYVDWDATKLSKSGYRMHLGPAPADDPAFDPEHVFWARCEADRRPWPQLSSSQFRALGKRIELVTTPKDPQFKRLEGFAGFLTKSLEIDVSVRVKRPGAPDRGPTHSPLTVDLSPGESRMAKWLDLATQAERAAMAKVLAQMPADR